jgi:hypothetical protein
MPEADFGANNRNVCLTLSAAIFYRKEIGKRFTKKLQTPAPRRRGYSPTCGAGTTAS